MNTLQLVALPFYVGDITIRIAHQSVKCLYFNFEPRSVPSNHTANLYYPTGGVTDPQSTGMVMLERRNLQSHLAVFDSVTEAVAALSRLPMKIEFTPAEGCDTQALASSFVNYCIQHGLVAPYYNREAAEEEIDCLLRALANESERPSVVTTESSKT